MDMYISTTTTHQVRFHLMVSMRMRVDVECQMLVTQAYSKLEPSIELYVYATITFGAIDDCLSLQNTF